MLRSNILEHEIVQALARKLILELFVVLKIKKDIIDQFRYIKTEPKTIDLNTRLWGINTEFVG